MTTFEASVILNQPIDIIVKALMNPDNFPYWQKDLKKFEVIKRAPGEVGSIGHLHYSQKGRSYVLVDKMIYCEPGKKYVSQITGDAIEARVETTLRSSGNDTEMHLKWSGKGKVPLLKILLPLFRGKMIRQTKEELETFKKLVETKGSNFSKDSKN